ncbi:MAG: HIT domain-containing protein [Planctomycetota bacterium]
MKHLWAPWRREYILREPGEKGCFLCEAAGAPEAQWERHLTLLRGQHVVAVLNRYPYNTGHFMVAPARHLAQPEELTAQEVAEMWQVLCRLKERLSRTSRPDGFNVGINLGDSAGAGLPGHIHVHVVPRWVGDTNFLAVLGETKVMPESLESVYRKLTEGGES